MIQVEGITVMVETNLIVEIWVEKMDRLYYRQNLG